MEMFRSTSITHMYLLMTSWLRTVMRMEASNWKSICKRQSIGVLTTTEVEGLILHACGYLTTANCVQKRRMSKLNSRIWT